MPRKSGRSPFVSRIAAQIDCEGARPSLRLVSGSGEGERRVKRDEMGRRGTKPDRLPRLTLTLDTWKEGRRDGVGDAGGQTDGRITGVPTCVGHHTPSLIGQWSNHVGPRSRRDSRPRSLTQISLPTSPIFIFITPPPLAQHGPFLPFFSPLPHPSSTRRREVCTPLQLATSFSSRSSIPPNRFIGVRWVPFDRCRLVCVLSLGGVGRSV